jgi:hypothetical protein
MPKIESWDKLPALVRQHLIECMRDRDISIADLHQLRLWIESRPEVPEGNWYKDFGSFKICGQGSFRKRSCFPAKRPKAKHSIDLNRHRSRIPSLKPQTAVTIHLCNSRSWTGW